MTFSLWIALAMEFNITSIREYYLLINTCRVDPFGSVNFSANLFRYPLNYKAFIYVQCF